MFNVGEDWNPKQAELKKIILDSQNFNEAIKLALEPHSTTHSAKIGEKNKFSLEDEIWKDLDQISFKTMPTINDVTIAWNMWHITRIEDITCNILISDSNQIISEDKWQKRLNTSVLDTGNAMTDEEIIKFSEKINLQELKNYRNAVGIRQLRC